MIDVYPVKRGETRIKFEPEKINKLLGTDISKEDMLAYFEKIDLGYDEASGEVVAPSWRQDLLRMAIWQRKWQDSMAMTRFRPHFHPVKQPQESFPIS